MKNISHKIKHRDSPNDKIYTPFELAKTLIEKVSIYSTDRLLDPFMGTGAFYKQFPKTDINDWCEIEEGKDFFEYKSKVDIIISNPPYSCLDKVLEHSANITQKSINYLLLGHAITPKRIEMMEVLGFGLTQIHYCKVFKWYGISVFCSWEKNIKSIVQYDRIVWK